MYSIIHTALLNGIQTIPVQVEVDISSGLPVFDMVGYLASEVREAKERVRTALHNCGITLPAKRITMNLTPANIRKTGTGFDLPIAVSLLCAMGILNEEVCGKILFIGELGLNGDVLPVNGVLPIVADGRDRGCEVFAVPAQNLQEARLVASSGAFGFSDFRALVDFLNDGVYEDPEIRTIDRQEKELPDFSEVNGQQLLRRACEVAAAGMHNMLMIGPPGAGKTMISERMRTILPPLSGAEQLELSKIYSVRGMLQNRGSLLTERPFRSPHHTISRPGLTGGGLVPRPGEISLAHHGVLFLDELPEFQKNTLEVLRQPLEEHKIILTRASGSVEYPADFLLLAAMNPCRCGYYPDMQRCRCTPTSIRQYLSQISRPLIDRIDICVQAEPLTYADLTGSAVNESSASIRERVCACQLLQEERFSGEEFSHNSQIPASRLPEFCSLDAKGRHYMENMYGKLQMTGRTYHKVLRVARTIADLDEKKDISISHLSEAVCYRSMCDSYWRGDL